MTIRVPLITYFFCVAALATNVCAEEFQFTCTADQDSVTVGDRILLRLELLRPQGDTSVVVPDLKLPAALQILGSPRATSALQDGFQLIAQTIELTSFKTGAFTIPSPVVQLIRSVGDTLRLEAGPIDIFVASVKPEDLEDIADIRPPVDIEAQTPTWAWVLIGVVALLVALAVWVLFFRRRSPPPAPPSLPTDWFEEIRRIGRAGLVESGDFLTYYTSLSEALRRFLEDRAGVDAMERTTGEVGDDLSAAGLRSGRVVDVMGFLEEADLVKFARYSPDSDRARKDLDRVLQAMGGVESDLKPVTELPADEFTTGQVGPS